MIRRKKYDLLVEKKDAYMMAYLSLESLVEKLIDAHSDEEWANGHEASRAEIEFNLSATLDEIWSKRNGGRSRRWL